MGTCGEYDVRYYRASGRQMSMSKRLSSGSDTDKGGSRTVRKMAPFLYPLLTQGYKLPLCTER